ncbi:MAG: terminase [Terriglobia bacterium]
MNANLNPELMLMDLAAQCEADPLGFANAFWPESKPRAWQAEILAYVGEWLQNPATRHQPCRVAVSSGHDIGKSALIAMVEHWAMATCAGCKVVTTAGTGMQLATKTVPEAGKWFRSSLGAHWFDVRAQSIRAVETQQPESWRLDFVTWSRENTEAFAGLHNHGKRILLIFDEASAIDDKVWEVAEGALVDEDTEIIWLAFGNPTRNSGRFRECFGNFRHRWKTCQIDSRTVEGTNKTLIAQWIADYGEDSDFVRVRVRGEFPRAGGSQFIGGDMVAAARKFRAADVSALPKILSVDVARFGDDQTVIGARQGRKFSILEKLRGKDTVFVANRVIEWREKEKPDAVVVDGDGIGAGVVDQMRYRGFGERLFEFHGGQNALNSDAYFNRRAETWGAVRDWLAAGAEIPDDPELAADLAAPEYGFSARQQIQLERKEDMKKRGLASPDSGDCLAMTFSVTIVAPPKAAPPHRPASVWG